MRINKKENNPTALVIDYRNLGNLHLQKTDWSTAEKFYLKSLDLNEKAGRKGEMADLLGSGTFEGRARKQRAQSVGDFKGSTLRRHGAKLLRPGIGTVAAALEDRKVLQGGILGGVQVFEIEYPGARIIEVVLQEPRAAEIAAKQPEPNCRNATIPSFSLDREERLRIGVFRFTWHDLLLQLGKDWGYQLLEMENPTFRNQFGHLLRLLDGTVDKRRDLAMCP